MAPREFFDPKPNKPASPTARMNLTYRPGGGAAPSRTSRRSADALQGQVTDHRRTGVQFEKDYGRGDFGTPHQADVAAWRAAGPQQPWPDFGNPGSPGGGGRRGGGGGGGGMNGADYDTYSAAMRQLLATMGKPQAAGANPFQGMDNPYAGMKSALAGQINPLTAMIDPAVNADLAAAKAAMAQVAGGVSMDNPYAGMGEGPGAQVNPDLAAFADTQGVGAQYGADVAVAQQTADTQNANWAGLAQALGGNFLSGQQDTVNIANQQGAQIQGAIRAQGTGLRAGAAQGQLKMDREAAMDQQGLDLQSRGFDASLQQMVAQAQMQLDAESRTNTRSSQDAKLQAIMQLINAGLPYGKAPSLEGLI